MGTQLDIFDLIYDKYSFKDINLIELFAGYGSQALALKYLGVKFKHHKICEWAVKSIQAYKDLHIEDDTDYSKDIKDEDVAQILFDKGISMNYNEPMTLEQIGRKGVQWQRKVYNDIIATHNLVDISRVHATDLEMNQNEDYIMTYSFPCQDLSLAGLGKGMERDSGTRSGLLWQVERILLECNETGKMPTVLLMENVPEVCGTNNQAAFNDWCSQLTRLGYHNTMAILNAKDFGIPQNRRRCFMLSIYGEYAFTMPTEMKLEYKLKDLLENNVNEKYYLSKKMITYVSSRMPSGEHHITTGINVVNHNKAKVSGTITTGEGSKPTSNYIIDNNYDYDEVQGKIVSIEDDKPSIEEVLDRVEKSSFGQRQSIVQKGDICGTILARDYKEPKMVIEDYSNKRLSETLQENEDIEDGDFIDAYNKTIRKDIAGAIITRVNEGNNTFVVEKMKSFVEENGYIPDMFNPYNCNEIKDIAPTQTAQCGSSTSSSTILVVDNLKQELCDKLIEEKLVEENDVIRHNYTNSKNGDCIQANNEAPTLDTRCDCLGVVVKVGNYSPSGHNAASIVDTDGIAPTVMENHGTITAIEEKDNYAPLEKALFTDDGNIKRYIDSDIVDEFKDGQMATTTYPNGYGHGPRVHDESVALNTTEVPSIKNNLRIRKLTPKECFRLMGVKDSDSEKIKQSDASKYHLAGDSIVTTCLMAIFGELLEIDYHIKIRELTKEIINENKIKD